METGGRKVFRRVCFWGAVAGVSVLANLGLELAAPRFAGLSRFTAILHKGAS